MSYFHPIYSDKHTILPGFGKIHSQTVGNTSHTTGYDHYFLADGAEKPHPGLVRFAAYVTEDGQIAWKMISASGATYSSPSSRDENDTSFPPEVIAEMRRISETLGERSPTGWFFTALSAVQMEIDRLKKPIGDAERAVEHLTLLLSDPNEPRQHFVSAEEAGQPKGFRRDATPAERDERRAMWQRNLNRDTKRLADAHVANDARLAMLKTLERALRNWSMSKQARGMSPMAIYQKALARVLETA